VKRRRLLEAALAPFRSAEARRLSVIFAVVYFAQGMWGLPVQAITFTLKEHFGYAARDVAALFTITDAPWLIKPVYGLLSDGLPLFGRRRQSYFMLASGLAAVAGYALGSLGRHTPALIAALFTAMGLGLAFTDVLTDALMVENGKRLRLTGGFQAVQWASIYTASVAVGVGGGMLTEHHALGLAFLCAAVFPTLSFVMAIFFIREPRVRREAGQFRRTWTAIRGSMGSRDLWAVAGFILFWTFSPSLGTPLFYYQTDTLKFSQQFIGSLLSLSAAGAIIGALAYGGLSRVLPLTWLLNGAIGSGVVSTLAYLLYASPTAAVVIDTAAGCVGMVATLAFLDLAAKASPRQAEGTFFALLMSVYNAGTQGSQIVGGWLYDSVGYANLVLISAAFTALCWLLVPLVRVEQIEARAGRDADPAA
jgi:predicted MFS family arabinose efflux permease